MYDAFLEDLKTRVDLVEVVRRYATLKKSGRNFVCRSPLRNERTPSFSVSSEKQVWYDFGASEGGDVIRFLERMENISFREAVETLADMAGVEVPKNVRFETPKDRDEKEVVFSLHERAQAFFATQLQKNKAVQDYLKNRGISAQEIAQWGIGYGGDAPDGLTKHLLEGGFSAADIARSGVAFERSFGEQTMKDRFATRLIIPIRQARDSRIVAFSGRDLSGKDGVAKYVNSPENPVYHKSSTLFALEVARKAIPQRESVIVVEGYFDAIAAHRAGYSNAVATCGTSLTPEHLRILRRLTARVFLAFDSDAAGKKATLRGVEMCLGEKLTPFIVDSDGGKDLDELARTNPDALKGLLESPPAALDFLLERFARKYLDGTIEGAKNYLDAFFPLLKLVERPLEVDAYLDALAQKLGRARHVIEAEFRRFSAADAPKLRIKNEPQEANARLTLQESAVGFAVAFSQAFSAEDKDKLLTFLTEEAPKRIFTRHCTGEPLAEDDQMQLHAWEMYQQNLFPEVVGDDVLAAEARFLLARLGKEAQAQQYFEAAKEIRNRQNL